jgi:hypothetical protein
VTTPIVCQRCTARVTGGSFCTSCGARLGAAQRSTGTLRALGERGDGSGLIDEHRGLFTALRRVVGTDDPLLGEGQELGDLLARWAVLDASERAGVFERFRVWHRAAWGEVLK